MKKKGAALVTVLVIFTALIIIATSISSSVINTTKLNKRYSDTIDLELAAKSGVNIIKDDFISKVNNGNIKTLDNVKTYISEVNNGNLNNLFAEYYNNDSINLTLTLGLDSSNSENKLNISSTAKKQGSFSVEKVEEQSLRLNIGSSSTGGNLSGILDEQVVLIIGKRNGIISMNHLNDGIIVVDEKKWYQNFHNSDGLRNGEKDIDSNINISIPSFGIENSTSENENFYLISNGITYNSPQQQDHYKITVDGKYKVNNYNDFIIVRVDGNLNIYGNGNAGNIDKKIIYVVNGNVTLDSSGSLKMKNTIIMANSVESITNNEVAFNSGLVITNSIKLSNGFIDRLDEGIRKNALIIIDMIIKGKSIE